MKSLLRLRRAQDYAYVRQQGSLIRGSAILMGYVKNKLPHNRYGFVTSKQLGNAVVRNRTKRRMREATYQLHPHLCQGYDIVLIARPKIVEQPFLELLRIQKQLYRRARLIEEDQHVKMDDVEINRLL